MIEVAQTDVWSHWTTLGFWTCRAGLIQATDGTFYGTTRAGGTLAYGTIFRVSRKGLHGPLQL
jgi:uncharacterized repeat protein (TIGR03803 family)